MYISKFNHFVSLNENESVLYNTFSGCIIKINNEFKKKIYYNSNALSLNEKETLFKLGVLVDSDDEQKLTLEFKRSRGIYSSDISTFRILVTTCCNARCSYCYEEGIKTSSMTIETAHKVIEFIKSRTINTKRVNIQWFGGEPTLNPEVMYYITSELKKYYSSQNKEISFSMITNGSLLDRITLEKMHLSRVQISLDGLHTEYLNRKAYLDKRIDLNSVLNNILMLLSYNIIVSIRLNYDNNNYESVAKLIEYLSTFFVNKDKIRIYPYPLYGTYFNHKGARNTTTKAQLIRLYQLISDNGFNDEMSFQKLRVRGNRCFACNYNSYVINADGKLYKCTACMNEPIGDVFNGVKINSEFLKWVNNRIEKECEECVFLPLCQGGCMAGQVSAHPVTCFLMKEAVDDIIRRYILNRDNENN